MQVMIKEPGLSPCAVDIQDRFLNKVIASVVGSDHFAMPFGNGIVLISAPIGEEVQEEVNFKFTYKGQQHCVFGPVIFANGNDEGVSGLDSNQLKIIGGCFHARIGTGIAGMPADNVRREIGVFLTLFYEGNEREIHERKNAIIARNVIEEPLSLRQIGRLLSETADEECDSSDVAVICGDTQLKDDAATDSSDSTEYVGKHAAKQKQPNEYPADGSVDDVVEAETLPEGADACEEWFVSHLLESADDDMSEKGKQQIIDVLLDKFRILMSKDRDDAFRMQMLMFIEGERSQEEKDEFFRFVTGMLIRHAGVREEYAKRHPDEYRVR